jgi:PKD repeat protein
MKLISEILIPENFYRIFFGAGGCLFSGRNCVLILGLILLSGAGCAKAPSADFSCIPATPGSLTISCTDQSTGAPTGWAWFFGDETFSAPWMKVNASTPWSPRVEQPGVTMPDGSIVVMGGSYRLTKNSGVEGLNDVWRSRNNGQTWERMTANAGWAKRMGASGVVTPDGSIVLMGGYGSANDTWRSTDNGATWTRMTSNSGWSARHHFTTVAMADGRIVLMGGVENPGSPNKNDVWRSADNGATWTLVNASSGWPPRFVHTSVIMPDRSIVLMGGYNQQMGYTNDVWRSADSGATWTQVKQKNSQTDWNGRWYHASVAMPDGSIVLTGGVDVFAQFKNDVWRSTDNGATWTLANANPGWSARDGHTTVAMPDGSIVLIGGGNGNDQSFYANDVWRLNPTASSAQNTSHTYARPGTYQVTLQVYNSGGFTNIRKTITVGAPTPGYYICIVPVTDKHVGEKFTITATTNMKPGEEVLVEVYSPSFDRTQKPPSGEFSGATGTLRVHAGANNINYFTFDVDSSTFKPGVYLINDTAMNVPGLGKSYFTVIGNQVQIPPQGRQICLPFFI